MSVSTVPVRFVRRRFGETARHDAWWVQPLVVFLGLSTFIVYATWAAFQGEHYTLRPVPLAVLFSGDLRRSRLTAGSAPSRRAWPALAAVFAGAADPADSGAVPVHLLLLPRRLLQGVLGGPAVVHRRRAALELLGRELVSARPAERPSLHAVHLRWSCSCILVVDVWKASGSPIRRRARCRSASASARSCWPRTRAAQRISLRLPFDAAHGRRLRRSALARAARPARVRLRELPQSAAHGVGVDAACSPSASLTCTSGCAPWACGRTCRIF